MSNLDEKIWKTIHDFLKSGLSWSKITTEVSKLYNDVPKKSKDGWRHWYNYRANRPYVLKEQSILAASPMTKETEEGEAIGEVKVENIDGNLEERIWETTGIDKDNWAIDYFKAWTFNGAVQFSAKFSQQFPEYDIHETVRQALGPVDWGNIKGVSTDGEYLWVPSLYDLHIGKMGNDMPDDAYLWTLQSMTIKAELIGNIGHVLFVLGQDFGHIDNVQRTTTKGTPQETDDNYHGIVSRQAKLAVQAIRYLAEKYETTVLIVPGNHDKFSNAWLGALVEAVFEDHPNVTVDNGRNPRKYFQWGNMLLMSTHGRDERLNNIAHVISVEARELWGNTKRCEVLVGDIHTRRETIVMVDEVNGVLIRYLPSLSGTDTWHLMKTFVGNVRGGMGFLYSEDSCKYTINVSLDEVISERT